MSLYELAILGRPPPGERELLIATIERLVAEFDLELGRDVVIHSSDTVHDRDKRAAFAAVYFGNPVHADIDAVRELLRASATIIPTVGPGEDFTDLVPDLLKASNGLSRRSDDTDMSELAVALLECVGLLRRQRRVFVSYRRVESRAAAMQLHDLMTARGFDVFLDTHDIRPGEPFQEVLWRRLVDSDVVMMLDTPTYFDSKWTRQEIGRARAKEIHVLRVVWPGHEPSKMTDFGETLFLNEADLRGPDGPIADEVAAALILKVERLRSKSIASRFMAITGRLRVEVEKIGATVEGIGAHHAITVRLVDERHLWVFPVVGIPSAETLHDISVKARQADQRETPALAYDHVGIGAAWTHHLDWLDDEIRSVRAIKVSEAGWALAGWEG